MTSSEEYTLSTCVFFYCLNIELANEETNEEKLHLFKKVGSNFQIKDRTVFFEPRGAWKTLLDSGIFGGNAFVSRLRRDSISASNSDFQFWRKREDSNLRSRFRLTAFQVRRIRPLCHASLKTTVILAHHTLLKQEIPLLLTVIRRSSSDC